ncbi:MAG: long-chain fatty acid transport protein [Candidatus Magnetoglobus multicellularis str. Araruama]|uniref:Long-chain fatty acid transport protein n=1 Tax=Candidatus Magnetoglobus multicellularis str. Araruama TaxID=890399 RepID=A0A1V1P2U3_9BACT|nr:MAG: long-chain fatty acid transport protein [Candidatus Magnetoglobus multicellularis str. Araruama]
MLGKNSNWKKISRKKIVKKLFYIISISFLISGNVALSDILLDFASTPNPLGSGARAIGMGGAFIGVADDATAASWNPGGLIQLEKPEVSIVGNFVHRIENIVPNHTMGAKGFQSIDLEELNYFSISNDFQWNDLYMVFSLNYQKLYNFNREWDFPIALNNITLPFVGTADIQAQQHYRQDGSLSALGFAFSMQLSRQLSVGFTINYWDEDICNNKWEEFNSIYSAEAYMEMGGIQIPPVNINDIIRHDEYKFEGINYNLGFLFRPVEDFTIGMVYKTQFNADIAHRIYTNGILESVLDEKMKMPASYGIGISYRFSQDFRMSADYYETQWQHFMVRDENDNEVSGVTKQHDSQSDVDPTRQIRVGAEYYFTQPAYRIPFRCGLFYDPAPSNGSVDDYWGFSSGSGFISGNIEFDMAYQYRKGNDVGDTIVREYNFEMDVEEHLLFGSLIVSF